MLKSKEIKFIIAAFLLTIIFCGGLYVNHQLDRLVTVLSSTGLLFVYPEDGAALFPPGMPGALEAEGFSPGPGGQGISQPAGNGMENANTPGHSTAAQSAAPASGGSASENSGSNSAGGSKDGHGSTPGSLPGSNTSAGNRLEQEIAAAVQQKLDRPLAKKDLLKAGLVILRKLNAEEIGYLYSVGSRSSNTRDELLRVREILLAKLSPGDIRTLQEIGARYGKQLRILDADVPLK